MRKMWKLLLVLIAIIVIGTTGTITYLYVKPGALPEFTDALPVGETVQESVEEEDITPAEPERVNVVGLGDSLTKGVGDRDRQGYIGYVSNRYFEADQNHDVTITNYAITGNETEDLLKRLDDKVVKESIQEADYIFLTIGGNDLFGVVKNHFLNLDQQYFALQKKSILKIYRKG
ncbi:GDSL-type esterase/lipase family protein [Pseudalkalibacillus hwajinpoensis]|uniref:GDSL-type esterase/lipase family protein n=1 Tax=Guptibacillus hwajinpoensis TaxID=208199 RepID=UPI00325BA9A1